MSSDSEADQQDLLDHVLLPVANEADAEATATALELYEPKHVTTLHVVEKGEGVPDKTPVEQSEEVAADAYAAVRSVFPGADEHTAYDRHVVDAIFEAADDVGASAIAFHSRGGSRLLQFLSGDTTLKLVTKGDIPVIALPNEGRDE